jgi:hypothetical protein
MANQSAGMMTDYGLRTFIETWWEPTLRHLVLQERYYENDEVVLRLCAQKARLFPRFGPEKLSEMIEVYDADVKVNVGMGASDPGTRLQKFLLAVKWAMTVLGTPVQGMNKLEVIKEIFSMVGYRDGARFIEEQVNPQVAMLMQALQRMKQALEGEQMKLAYQGQLEQAKLASNERIQGEKLRIDEKRIDGDIAFKRAELMLEQSSTEADMVMKQMDAAHSREDHQMKMAEAQMKLVGAREKHMMDMEKTEAKAE